MSVASIPQIAHHPAPHAAGKPQPAPPAPAEPLQTGTTAPSRPTSGSTGLLNIKA